jgi:hypothetical protein
MVRRLLVPIDSLSTDSTDTNRALRQIQFHDGERGKDLQLHGVRTCCRDRVLINVLFHTYLLKSHTGVATNESTSICTTLH